MFIVLALIVVPDTQQPLLILKSGNIDALICRPAETLNCLVPRLKGKVHPFVDERFPLVRRVQQNLLLSRDQRPMYSLIGCQDRGRCRRGGYVDETILHCVFGCKNSWVVHKYCRILSL